MNSINLFDPALAGLIDFADVFSLSNLPTLTGPDASHLLVLSQESGKIVNIAAPGAVSSSLTIVSDPGNPLSVPDQQHEGLTMDNDGVLYMVSENGGGDINHPQLWVYAPSSAPNQAPTGDHAEQQGHDAAREHEHGDAPQGGRRRRRRRRARHQQPQRDRARRRASSRSTAPASTSRPARSSTSRRRASYTITVNVDDPTVGTTPGRVDAVHADAHRRRRTRTRRRRAVVVSEVCAVGQRQQPRTRPTGSR